MRTDAHLSIRDGPGNRTPTTEDRSTHPRQRARRQRHVATNPQCRARPSLPGGTPWCKRGPAERPARHSELRDEPLRCWGSAAPERAMLPRRVLRGLDGRGFFRHQCGNGDPLERVAATTSRARPSPQPPHRRRIRHHKGDSVLGGFHHDRQQRDRLAVDVCPPWRQCPASQTGVLHSGRWFGSGMRQANSAPAPLGRMSPPQI